MMVMIEASILSADAARLGEEAREAEAAGCEAVQVDVMDGHFVPNITFGPGVVKAVRSHISVALDVHLMIYRPEQYLQAFVRASAPGAPVHPRSGHRVRRLDQSRDSPQCSGGSSGHDGFHPAYDRESRVRRSDFHRQSARQDSPIAADAR